MTADGKIYIIITDKLPSGGGDAVINEPEKKDKKTDLFEHWAANKIIETVKQTATSAVTYQLSNIGNFTGDYITQTHVNDTLKAVNALVSIGTSAIAGAKVGGVWGAVIGATLQTVNLGVQSALNIHTQRLENNKTNYEIAQLRARSGLNPLLDGSRGTEN